MFARHFKFSENAALIVAAVGIAPIALLFFPIFAALTARVSKLKIVSGFVLTGHSEIGTCAPRFMAANRSVPISVSQLSACVMRPLSPFAPAKSRGRHFI